MSPSGVIAAGEAPVARGDSDVAVAHQVVVPCPAEDDVVARSAEHGVGGGGAGQDVVAIPADQQFPARAAGLQVDVGQLDFGIGEEAVVAPAAAQEVAVEAADQEVVVGAAVEDVDAVTAFEAIFPGPAGEEVVAALGLDQVVAGAAVHDVGATGGGGERDDPHCPETS
jgi:hypothetical protein